MIKKIELEAKTVEEALEKATIELNAPKEEINITLLKENKGFLGMKANSLYEASYDVNLTQIGKNFLDTVLEGLEISYKMEVRTLNEGNDIYYSIESSENPLLIGREGKTLDALQYLLRNVLYKYVDDRFVVSLDIGSYRETRQRQLEILATKSAKEVIRTNIPVKLDPLNSFERRIIHAKLSEWRDVYTESEGEGENRRLVIKPKK